MQRVLELDGLRAIAILLVIGCHYEAFVTLTHQVSAFGWVGVDIFFVLSGYLITTILLGLKPKANPYRTFYARRIIRIFPPYIAVTIAVLLLAVAAHARTVYSVRSVVGQVLFLQATPAMRTFKDVLFHPLWRLTHLPSLLENAHQLPLGAVGLLPGLEQVFPTYWSLSIEEYFYLLWAPMVLRLSRRWIVWTGLFISIAEIYVRWSADTPRIYFNLFGHFDALLYGALLAILLERCKKQAAHPRVEQRLAAAFFLCVVLDCVMLYLLHPVVGYEIRASPLILAIGLPVFWIGVACLLGLLVLRSGSGWWPAKLLRTRPLQYLGTISYTMYLVHLLAAGIVLKLARVLHVGARFPLMQALVSVAITILLARLSWRYIEKPALRWKDRHFPSSPHPPEPTLS